MPALDVRKHRSATHDDREGAFVGVSDRSLPAARPADEPCERLHRQLRALPASRSQTRYCLSRATA